MQKGIGKRIRDARKAAGLTQEELAERIGTSSVAVAQWETGRRNPKMGTVSKLAAALDEPQRRTNPRVEISPYSVVFIIPLPRKLVR